MLRFSRKIAEEIESLGFEWEIEGSELCAWKSEYLDNGHGLYGRVSTMVTVNLNDGRFRVTVDGLTQDDIDREIEKLLEECPNEEISCDDCDAEACELSVELEWLEMIKDLAECWENNFPFIPMA